MEVMRQSRSARRSMLTRSMSRRDSKLSTRMKLTSSFAREEIPKLAT